MYGVLDAFFATHGLYGSQVVLFLIARSCVRISSHVSHSTPGLWLTPSLIHMLGCMWILEFFLLSALVLFDALSESSRLCARLCTMMYGVLDALFATHGLYGFGFSQVVLFLIARLCVRIAFHVSLIHSDLFDTSLRNVGLRARLCAMISRVVLYAFSYTLVSLTLRLEMSGLRARLCTMISGVLNVFVFFSLLYTLISLTLRLEMSSRRARLCTTISASSQCVRLALMCVYVMSYLILNARLCMMMKRV